MQKIIIALSLSLFVGGCSGTVSCPATTPPVNTEKAEAGNSLQVQETSFIPEQLEHYTLIPMKFEKYTIEQVQNGVYIGGVHAHSGEQLITIYSKVNAYNSQSIKAERDGDTLKVFVEEKLADSRENSKEHAVYTVRGVKTANKVTKYEVYRNGKLEQPIRVGFGIE